MTACRDALCRPPKPLRVNGYLPRPLRLPGTNRLGFQPSMALSERQWPIKLLLTRDCKCFCSSFPMRSLSMAVSD
ncbi:MAG: hypothetical protein KZQ66_01570 [Candidatus Thiodiazotropha sp. (ex Lucinoma aequizonata)]|nr:hypothetical protein [Candidatus Thiodiazotropha sp. (ex Lucinoma aequizonata)]MCU7887702.1 hypothetical protein [Candidatus Thiodiazotropha sp. (ex Lucinoma aequizonata)]MCU7895556.1 hypothetical protein [Candidatus Thiodiazotropha sp. (ex Lucinoma aequizonata)]MCU7900248.1 hypothetical protein [Candidatus Thiodiazotropha sp. (ex Lucinoma aequizonata)]MCU7900861.1 hypothetical protein [Candidatus Thiodiazotropha sp. (ex Lucinoma aequizonata)]